MGDLPLDKEGFVKWWQSGGSDRIEGEAEEAYDQWRAEKLEIALMEEITDFIDFWFIIDFTHSPN